MYEDTFFDKITQQKEIDNLKKYTAPKRCKIYYENHKEEIINKIKANKPTPDRIIYIYYMI